MSAILTFLLQSLPTLLALFSQIWAIVGPLINHQKSVAMAAAGNALSATEYHLYVTAEGVGGTALAIGLACCQPKMNQAFRLLRKRAADRAAAEMADELAEQLNALPAAHRDRVLGHTK